MCSMWCVCQGIQGSSVWLFVWLLCQSLLVQLKLDKEGNLSYFLTRGKRDNLAQPWGSLGVNLVLMQLSS